MNVQILDRTLVATSGRPPTIHCDAPGCVRATKEGKPFCSEHVEKNSYVAKLLAQMDVREKEQTRAIKRGGGRNIQPDSSTVSDILEYLRFNGERSIPRIARDLLLDKKLVESYIRYCRKKGLVSTGKTAKHITTARVA